MTDAGTSARPARRLAAPTTEHLVAWAILAAVAVAFLALSLTRITAPFGDSDEGINGAVWGADSQGLRVLGPLESRLGGVRVDQTKYATHPPLIVIETAALERVLGTHAWSTRAAAWLGSLASIVLLYLLVRALALRPVTAAVATATALACHMFFVYGSMLDTMIIALPFALATTLVWYRQWIGAREPNPWLLLVLASVTCLSGWQATFLVGLCGVATAARWRSQPGAWRRSLPYLAGVVLGVVATVGWAFWVYGSLAVLDDKLIRRTGGTEAVSVADMISFQMPWLGQLLGVGLLAWLACAVSLRDRRFRPVAALALTSVIAYALAFKEGSGGHQYWNYWGLVPAAIGVAYVFGALDAALQRRFRKNVAAQWGALVGVGLLVIAVNAGQPNQAADLIQAGYAPYDLVAALPLAPGQTTIPYLAEPYRMDDWLRYRGGPAGEPITNEEQLRRLATERPDTVVVLLGSCAEPDATGVCERLTFGSSPGSPATVAPRAETAAALVATLDQGARTKSG